MSDAIENPNDGVIGVNPIYQKAYLDTFRETMKIVEQSIDSKTDKGITGKEYATVYLGSIQYALATSSQLAKDEAESRFKVENVLVLDMKIKQEQVKQLQAETYFKYVQAEQIVQSVYDNRLIKIIDSLASMVGMILNGGTQSVPTGLLDTLVSVLNIVKAIPKITYPMVAINSPIDMYDVSVDTNGNKIYTVKTSVTISGSVRDVAVGSTVHVQVNGSVYNATVSASDEWSVAIAGAELEADVNRSLYATVSATDSQGNVRVTIDNVSYMDKSDA